MHRSHNTTFSQHHNTPFSQHHNTPFSQHLLLHTLTCIIVPCPLSTLMYP
jgi:hypothetical protein